MGSLKNKKVLVTGSEGFIGSHLVEELLGQGCTVRAFVLYNSFNSWGWLETLPDELKNKLEIFTGDVRDSNSVRMAMKDIDIVFHLAALIAIPYSYSAPESYVDTNIKGTLNILNAARDLNTSRILVTSTSEVYGTALYVPIDEKHPRQGQSPYSASKIGADVLSDSFYRSFGTPVSIVRPFNTYGPRQSARAVIPTIITQLLAGKTEIKLGSLHPTRDLLFVKDTVKGFTAIAQCDELTGHEVNIATHSEITVGVLAQKLINHINPEAQIISDDVRLRPANSEVERLFGSDEKLRKYTSWKPAYTLDQGLQATIEWFREGKNMERFKTDIYNV